MRPIVLAHGFPGFSHIGDLTYFAGVAPSLQESFRVPVLTTQVRAVDPIGERALQLAGNIETLLRENNLIGQRVYLIAHSGGGLDARRLVSPNGLGRADMVATISTVSTPHHGSSVADAVVHLMDDPLSAAELPAGASLEILFQIVRDRFLHPLLSLSNFVHDIPKAVATVRQSLTAEGIREGVAFIQQLLALQRTAVSDFTISSVQQQFNPRFKDSEEVVYFSYAGVTNTERRAAPVFALSQAIVNSEGDNDGYISVASATYEGTPKRVFKGTRVADHVDEIGHNLDLTRPNFDHLALYHDIAANVADL